MATCPNCKRTSIVLYRCTECGTIQCSWGVCKANCYACGAAKKPVK